MRNNKPLHLLFFTFKKGDYAGTEPGFKTTSSTSNVSPPTPLPKSQGGNGIDINININQYKAKKSSPQVRLSKALPRKQY